MRVVYVARYAPAFRWHGTCHPFSRALATVTRSCRALRFRVTLITATVIDAGHGNLQLSHVDPRPSILSVHRVQRVGKKRMGALCWASGTFPAQIVCALSTRLDACASACGIACCLGVLCLSAPTARTASSRSFQRRAGRCCGTPHTPSRRTGWEGTRSRSGSCARQ